MTVTLVPNRLPLTLHLAYLVALATLIWLGSAPLTMALFGAASAGDVACPPAHRATPGGMGGACGGLFDRPDLRHDHDHLRE